MTGDRDSTVAIACRGITKRFGVNTVVDGVDLEIRAGSIHSLVGANGAGKSTLLGMISGRIAPSDGIALAFGDEIVAGKPRRARELGIATVYQELTIVPQLSAVANVFLGNERRSGAWLDEKSMLARFAELCDEFELDIPAKTLGRDLSVATQQVLEIMRAMNSEARIMMFDEPTAALSQSERDNFLRIIRRLAATGVAVVLVSHNLGEVLDVSATVSVLRGGRLVETRTAAKWQRKGLIHAMTGEATPVSVRNEHPAFGEPLFEVENLTVPSVLTAVSLVVRKGEIVGLAGLVGSGRTTILRCISGDERRATGTFKIDGEVVAAPRSVRDAIMRLGIGRVPEERKIEGLHLQRSIPDNIAMTDWRRFIRGIFVNKRKQYEVANELLTEMRISRPIGEYPVGDLSGGNQQKVAIAKWLARKPRVLLFDEPTRGIDVVAKVEVMAAIRRYAREGHAVIVTSSELEEVVDISDRLYVVSKGEIVEDYDMHSSPPTLNEIIKRSFAKTG
ncbi:MAG: sugar ABC transporter ATP-binding protein [Actinomycetota bacterium]